MDSMLPQIMPLRELKNIEKIERIVVDGHTPVVLTEKGYASLIVINIPQYEKMFGELPDELKKPN